MNDTFEELFNNVEELRLITETNFTVESVRAWASAHERMISHAAADED